MSLFSDNIRALRIKNKMSQEKVAQSLQITRARYVKYEYGTSEAPYELLKKIALYYQLSIDVLLLVDVREMVLTDVVSVKIAV